MRNSKYPLTGLLIGSCLAMAGAAVAQSDVRARVHVQSADHPRATVHGDRFRRMPPDLRVRGFPSARGFVRVSPFRAHLGWRVSRFDPRERAIWTHGRWWHGRHNGRLGWWWWADGGWFFYDAPVYPYPDYVSDYVYEEPSEDYGDYWYYCRDPEGYYPYVKRCYGTWEPVPPQPEGAHNGEVGRGYDDQGSGPEEDEIGPDDYGPPGQGAPDGQEPPEDQGPPDDQGPPPQ